jgi:hypothetical protein
MVRCLPRLVLDLDIPAIGLQERSWPLFGSDYSFGFPAFSPGDHNECPERIRYQHAELSHVRLRSPTHTSAAAHRKFFSKTKIYKLDK